METCKKNVSVYFVHEENVNHMILSTDPKKTKAGKRKPGKESHRSKLEDENNHSPGSPTEEVPGGLGIRSTLLCDDTDVTGRELFGIDRSTVPSSKNAVKTNLQCESPGSRHKTPLKENPKGKSLSKKAKTPVASEIKTPKHARVFEEPAKTPYNTRKKYKKELVRAQAVKFGGSSDSDFSPSDSDFSSNEENSESEENSGSEEETRSATPPKLIHVPNRRVSLRQKERNHDHLDYVIDADEYFRLGKAKSRTSNHTLSKLKTPRLPPDELRTLLEKTKKTHELPIRNLIDEQKNMFAKWMFVLSEGHSVLTYGVGSKRTLLNSFHKECIKFPVLVCNGYFPSLTINQIVDSITEGILGMKCGLNLSDSMECVERSFRAGSKNRMLLVIHNIEGSCLRSTKNQEFLARIAKLANVWFVASIDHINGPFMWDQSMLSSFNFSYWDATSLLAYTEETSYESSLMIQRTGTLMLSSLTNVFKSLTNNARGIFMVIVDYQLSRGQAKGTYQGMQFKDLYRSCRDKMLVSSDQTLRAQLTEFLDHKLVVSKRGASGSEMLTIPLEDSLLETFVEQRADE